MATKAAATIYMVARKSLWDLHVGAVKRWATKVQNDGEKDIGPESR